MLSQKGGSVTKQSTGRPGKKQDNGILPLGVGSSGVTALRNAPRDIPPSYNDADIYRGQPDSYGAPQDAGYPSSEANYQPQDQGIRGPADKYGSPYDNPYQSESAGQGMPNPADEEEFQRRMEEYYRENGAPGGPSDLNPYGANDDLPAYSREQDTNPYSSPKAQPDYQAYQNYDAESSPSYKKPAMTNPYESTGQPAHTGKRANNSQHNYLVNNPLAPDMPQNRTPGGFRAHQDIKHDHMGVDRQAKLPLTQGNAGDAYNVIKRKYGNHSAQYNILTGN